MSYGCLQQVRQPTSALYKRSRTLLLQTWDGAAETGGRTEYFRKSRLHRNCTGCLIMEHAEISTTSLFNLVHRTRHARKIASSCNTGICLTDGGPSLGFLTVRTMFPLSWTSYENILALKVTVHMAPSIMWWNVCLLG